MVFFKVHIEKRHSAVDMRMRAQLRTFCIVLKALLHINVVCKFGAEPVVRTIANAARLLSLGMSCPMVLVAVQLFYKMNSDLDVRASYCSRLAYITGNATAYVHFSMHMKFGNSPYHRNSAVCRHSIPFPLLGESRYSGMSANNYYGPAHLFTTHSMVSFRV